MKKINWSKDFLKYFYINENKIINKDENYIIYISKDNLIEDEERELDKYTVQDFIIKQNGNKVNIKTEIPLHLNKYWSNNVDDVYNIEKEMYVFNSKKLPVEYPFFIVVNNEGVADPLLKIKDLMEKNFYIKNHTIEEVFAKYIELLNQAGVDINSCHIEVILREMLFITENGNDKRIFAEKDEFPKYSIMNITEGIQLGSKSPSKSLMFEQVQKQFMTDSYNNVFSKNGTSSMDLFLED